MEFIDFGAGGYHDGVDGASEHTFQQPQNYNPPVAPALQDQSKSSLFNPNAPQPVPCEIKPRLTKEQHDILEAHYQNQPKPNTSVKKGFAESLNVSLDKVNNWFQNRRAKSKQDAKKQAGALNLFQSQQNANHYNFSPDSDTSPSFTSPEYMHAMQQWSPDEHGLGISSVQLPIEHENLHGVAFTSSMADAGRMMPPFVMLPQMHQAVFDSPEEANRRTLTQEQFDAFARNGGMMTAAGTFEELPTGFSGNHNVMHQVFPDLQHSGFKQQDVFAFPHPVGAPLSSNDSSIPSTISDQSMPPFPSSHAMQPSLSASSSDWTDSRSSSLSMAQHDASYFPVSGPHHQAAAVTNQWRPGQSVPVDFNALSEQFKQASHGRHAQEYQIPQEQPLAWPADEAYLRRDSQAAALTQSMNNIGIHTPQPQQPATFKSPAPAASIAARRQRPRPAALGLDSMRSHSYSAGMALSSPGQVSQPQLMMPGQPPLRRIRSSNVVNGVAQGRVTKPGTGSAQRSPLSWTFADAVNSPKLARHMSSQSQGNLAPPTPRSPGEFSRQEQARQYSPWQNSASHVPRQPSISETELERSVDYQQPVAVAPQSFSSPPHTPLYHPQQHAQQRVGNNVITENTPPQSAPASQQCFSSSVFAPSPAPVQVYQPSPTSQPQTHPPPQHQHQQHQQHMQAMAMSQPPPQYLNVVPPDQHMHMPFAPHQPPHVNIPVTTGPPPPQAQSALPLHFANGVPMVNADGTLELAFPAPPQLQFMHHQPPQPYPQPPPELQTPPQTNYTFLPVSTSAGTSPGGSVQMATAPQQHPPQQQQQQQQQQAQQPDFFVHEYTPPADFKRAATPRSKLAATEFVGAGSGLGGVGASGHAGGPKNYTFAHSGPEHFEGKKEKEGPKKAVASNPSPASSNGGSTSG